MREFDIVGFANQLLKQPVKRPKSTPIVNEPKRPEPTVIFTKRGLEEFRTLGQVSEYAKAVKKANKKRKEYGFKPLVQEGA